MKLLRSHTIAKLSQIISWHLISKHESTENPTTSDSVVFSDILFVFRIGKLFAQIKFDLFQISHHIIPAKHRAYE